jgi:iron complex transport system substrate-binding protein
MFLILTVLSLCACGAATGRSVPGNSEKMILVTDQAGRTVNIVNPVERIVSGFYISTSACITLGLKKKLIGIETRAVFRPIYTLAAPELLELPSVGTARAFNLEACIALKPDLVILPLRLRDAADILADVGIPSILVNPESYAELAEMIALLGKATGTVEAADRLLDYFERSITNINILRSAISDAERPYVYMCGVSSYLTTAPAGMYQSTMIELAGGKNAAGINGRSWTEISYEHLLAINPELMIIPAEAGYGVSDILAEPQLQRLKAVLGNRVYKMPDAFEAWDSPVPSFILGIKWLFYVLHEDIYSIDSLRKEAAAFYSDFFGINIDITLIE